MNNVLLDASKPFLNDQRLSVPPFTGANLTMRLLTSAGPIAHDTTLATLLAAEVGFNGYAPQVITGWNPSILTVDFRGAADALPVTFTNSGLVDSELIDGWFFYDVANNRAVLAGLFAMPFKVRPGLSVSLTPLWELTGEG
jgi:hypothetical protein